MASSAGCGRAPRRGCADASLYRRFRTLGLADVQIGPRLAVDRLEAELRDWCVFAEASALALLDAAEAAEWRAAVAQRRPRAATCGPRRTTARSG